MNFNFTNGVPVAIYENHNKKGFIYYTENEDKKKNEKLTDIQIQNIIEEFINKEKGRISMKYINEIYESLLNNEQPEDPKLKKLYDKIINASTISKNITINNNSVFPVINPDLERIVYYICGMSGSGKSTWVSHCIQQYIKMYPKNKVILFSNKKSDPVFDKIKKIIRVELNEELLEEPIELEELTKSMVIFDDIEFTPNKQINAEMNRIRDLILQQGRSYNISFCYVSHLLNNYKETRVILNECHAAILFPKMTTKYSLKYLLEKYFGFNKNDVDKLKNLSSRWVCVNKVPPYVVHSNGVYSIE